MSDLVRAGIPVLCTNQRSIDDIFRAVLLIGAALGCEGAARDLIRALGGYAPAPEPPPEPPLAEEQK